MKLSSGFLPAFTKIFLIACVCRMELIWSALQNDDLGASDVRQTCQPIIWGQCDEDGSELVANRIRNSVAR